MVINKNCYLTQVRVLFISYFRTKIIIYDDIDIQGYNVTTERRYTTRL